MTKYLEIGKIVNTHGVKGILKVLPLTDSPERFRALELVYAGIDDESLLSYTVESVSLKNNFVLVKLKEINTVEQAELLKNSFLKVDRANAVKLPEDSFFICDIIGMEVIDLDSREIYGILADVLKTGSNDVFLVKKEGMKDLLVPALKSVIRSVDFEKKRIEVTLPEGLLD